MNFSQRPNNQPKSRPYIMMCLGVPRAPGLIACRNLGRLVCLRSPACLAYCSSSCEENIASTSTSHENPFGDSFSSLTSTIFESVNDIRSLRILLASALLSECTSRLTFSMMKLQLFAWVREVGVLNSAAWVRSNSPLLLEFLDHFCEFDVGIRVLSLSSLEIKPNSSENSYEIGA